VDEQRELQLHAVVGGGRSGSPGIPATRREGNVQGWVEVLARRGEVAQMGAPGNGEARACTRLL